MASFYPDSKRNLHRAGNLGGGIRERVPSDYFDEFVTALK